jgi:hypothetical protein
MHPEHTRVFLNEGFLGTTDPPRVYCVTTDIFKVAMKGKMSLRPQLGRVNTTSLAGTSYWKTMVLSPLPLSTLDTDYKQASNVSSVLDIGQQR